MNYADYLSFVISTFALLIAALAAWRARQANDLAEKANKIAETSNQMTKEFNLRPLRLEAQNHLRDFAHSCAMFSTRFQMKLVDRASELLDDRDALRDRLQSLGPLDMPEIQKRSEEMMNKAVQLQRALDRTRGSDPKPLDPKFESIEDNIQALVEWFDSQRREIPRIVEGYLRANV